MKRRFGGVFCLLFLCVSFSLPVFAETQPARVFDDAALFSAEEAEKLEDRIWEVRESTGMDFVVVTTEDAGGLTAQQYADDYYDNHGFGTGEQNTGLLFLIDMDNREAYISTMGYAVGLFEDRIEAMLDNVFEYLPEGDYYASALAFLDSAEGYAMEGTRYDGTPNRYDPITDAMVEYRSFETVEILVAIFVPLGVAGVIFGVVCFLYGRTSKTVAYPFRQQSRLQLTQSNDQFIRRTVSTRHIETSSGSGGSGGSSGGGSHGGGGGSHGGGGRSF